MNIWITLLLLAIGIFLIVKGGDYFVDASTWIANVSGIPKFIIGATIVSVATTLPEMLVSVMAALQGKIDMSIGNAVGSVTANIGLIMAISLICIPSVIKRKDYLLKSIIMLVASAVVVVGGFFGKITLPVSVILLLFFVFFIFENIKSAKASVEEEHSSALSVKENPSGKEIAINIAKFIGGAAGIVFGARLLVDNASELARYLGVSERIIGVTIVAVGTSLPELVTTITAIVKKQASLSVGNIIGANIMDLTLIMPLSSIISGKTLTISPTGAIYDLPACLIVGLIAVIPALISSKFKRWQGFLLLFVYGVYLGLTCFC